MFGKYRNLLLYACVCGVICVYALNVRGVLRDPPHMLISVVAHRDLHIDKLFWFNIHFHMAVQRWPTFSLAWVCVVLE